MLLTAAAILAYRSSRSNSNSNNSSSSLLTEEEEKDWKKRLSRDFSDIREELQRPLELALLRCYSPTMDQHDTTTIPPSMSLDTATSFRKDVRKEWVQAVFGTDFPEADGNGNGNGNGTFDNTTRQGVGLAKIPSYTTYSVRIPPEAQGDKLGITLSRLALGLYVRNVRVGSEAWCVGIIPNSVLVSINGISLLAEPSKQALERIWQYEGHLEVAEKKNGPSSSTPENHPLCITHPIHMTLIHQGQLYTVTMLSNPPYGIDWSPCGNFALVKRTYAYGAKAGVKRGAIVAKVNDKTLYELDHTLCATELRNAFESGKGMQLQLCFTPPVARSGHFERQQLDTPQDTKPKGRQRPAAQHDGVEVRVHPILWNNKRQPNDKMSITQLACRVAGGELYSLPKNTPISSHKLYRPCPPLESLLAHWSREESLIYLMKYHQAGYDEREFIIRPNAQLVPYLSRTKQPAALVHSFLLPLISFLSHHPNNTDSLSSLLVEIAKFNVELAHQMELVAQALDNEPLKDSLLQLRRQREQDYQQLRQKVNTQQPQDPPCERAPPLPNQPMTGENESYLTMATSSMTSMTPSPDFKQGKPRIFAFFRKRNRKKLSTITNSPKTKTTTTTNPSPKKTTTQSESLVKSMPSQAPEPLLPTTTEPLPSVDSLFSSTLLFLEELDTVCIDIEKSLLRTFSQKIAGWALKPWSASKETALAQVTQVMRERLKLCQTPPLLNPIDSEMLVSLDPQGCYILPSAHFPLLLTFDCRQDEEESTDDSIFGPEKLYRTKVELVELRGASDPGRTLVVHACIAGTVVESGRSVGTDQDSIRWDKGNVLTFDSRSSWGAPQTISLRLSETSEDNPPSADGPYPKEVGFGWVDLASLWKQESDDSTTVSCQVWSSDAIRNFDEHGDLYERPTSERLEIELRVTTQTVDFTDPANTFSRKRSLLYKHDDDVRQEMFAIEFVKSCDSILKSCGLHLKLLTFRCIPVGQRRGFIEWVQGSVPLSEVCQPFAGSILGRKKDSSSSNSDAEDELSSVAKAGLTKYESLHRLRSDLKATNKDRVSNNPIQDYLRSCAYDPEDSYMIRKDVMDTYVKSCAGYCVITYLLGVGDRHLDNLLLHQSGHFFHCDYSFILGNDPKQYLPVRMTEDMVNGMGGRESDNFAMFLSLTCAAYLTLRRSENVRHLLSLVRLMEGCSLPDVEQNQSIEAAILGIRERLRLDLSEDKAISFMEKLIEESCSSRMWIAVDAIHTLGKRF